MPITSYPVAVRRVGFLLVLFVVVLSAVREEAQAQLATYEPIPVYVRPPKRVTRAATGASPDRVAEALRSIAKETGSELSEPSGESRSFRLTWADVSTSKMDESCEFPIRNLRNWNPMNTYKRELRVAFKEDWRDLWKTGLVEPNLRAIPRKKAIAEECGLTSGVYLDPRDGTVSCQPPGSVVSVERSSP